MLDRIHKSIAATMTILEHARTMTPDKAIVDGIEWLAKVAATFKGLVEEAARYQQGMAP